MRAPYGTYVRIINLLSFLSFQGACDHLLTFFRFCFAGMWTLDPIDGTKGFLRGRQYAVCLALLVDARVELGVIGSPNLPSTPPPGHLKTPLPEPRQNAQTTTAPAAAPSWHPIPTTQQLPQLPPPPTAAKAHAALDTAALVATRLGVGAAPVRMDSQVKYAALVRGDGAGGVYLRSPVTGPGHDGGS